MKLGIFKVNQLGDNVVFLPVVQALRRLYPEWQIELFTSPVAAELFSADLPQAQIHALPTAVFNGAWKRPATLLRLGFKVARLRLNATLIADDQGNVAHALGRLAGGKVRVGILPPFIKLRGGLTEIVSLPPALPVAQVNWEIARALVLRLGGTDWPALPPAPDLSHLHRGITPVAVRVVIHCGASLAYKQWFPERFVALANSLAAKFEVLWIEQPHTAAAELSPRVRRVVPASLAEFVATLRSASLLVGNNSGPMNLAAAMGCPAVILSGPSHPVWDPLWNADRIVILRDQDLPCLPCDPLERPVGFCRNTAAPMACMAHWSVETVAAQAVAWLERWSA